MDNVYRELAFGEDLSAYCSFDGFRLPTRVNGGNHFGTDDYFAFYKARVTDIRIPSSDKQH